MRAAGLRGGAVRCGWEFCRAYSLGMMTSPAAPRVARLTHPASLPVVAPSILSADFARMGEQCEHILSVGADWLHLDVMDGHFVPNLTMGPDMCKGLRRALPEAYLDVHLMVTDPGMFIKPFAAAGADVFTFHVEVVRERTPEMAQRIRDAGMAVGLAINPPTPVEAILPYLDEIDMALVMSVNPGFSGQVFIEDVLAKTRAIRARLRPEQRLQMDGGIGPKNAAKVRGAGCDVLVAASALFGVGMEERAGAIRELRGS